MRLGSLESVVRTSLGCHPNYVYTVYDKNVVSPPIEFEVSSGVGGSSEGSSEVESFREGRLGSLE